jgi:hypothetical protein
MKARVLFIPRSILPKVGAKRNAWRFRCVLRAKSAQISGGHVP